MDFVVTGARLIDGTGAAAIENGVLYIKGERIAYAGDDAGLPDEAQAVSTIDAAGKTLIPGIIDAHVHICWNGRESVLVSIARDRDELMLGAVETVRNTLLSGVTALRDIGGHHYLEMSIRKAINTGQIIGPRMRVSGRILAMTGGHAYFIAREADGPDEMRKAAREQMRAGADVIKMMATGGAATPGQDVNASQLTVEEMKAAVDTAHAMGRTAAAHCHGTGGIKNSVLAGMDSIEHCTYLTDETADMMAEHGTQMVLTLGVANPDPDKIPPSAEKEAERLKPIFKMLNERTHESINIAREKGVFIGIGTDAGGNALAPHDFSMAKELELLVKNGFSPMEALTIGTSHNAKVLRWEDNLGTLEAGKYADFVILDENPLENISNVRCVNAVYKGGEKVVY
ncbi:MAG: amidohydrolase family protein [Chloroflexota bacterium]